MIARRTFLATSAAVALSATWKGQAQAQAMGSGGLVTARFQGADQDVPVIGIGTARRYADPGDASAMGALRDTLARFVELGGQVIDTAPSYGRAEEVLGELIQDLGVRDRVFIATKVGADDRERGAAQIEASFRKLRTDVIDMIAVHNLRDTENQLATLRDLKASGRIRSIGATTSSERQYAAFEAMMRSETLDVIQIDYALDNREAADRILPLAQDLGLTVMINLPFGRGRLFQAVQDRQLPNWAHEIGATSWAQVFLKYIVSHPAQPIAVPGTAQVRYADDNLGAARAPLPDAALRRRMEEYIDAI